MAITEPTVVEESGHVSYGKDESSFVRFFHTEKGKDKDGNAILSEMIEIICPGDTKSEMRRPVQEMDKRRWPNAYNAWKNGTSQNGVGGYPLDSWNALDNGQIRDLNYKRIYTLEQLIAVPDGVIGETVLGGRALQAKAKVFLEINDKTAEKMDYAAKFEESKKTIAFLEKQNSDMMARMEVLESLVQGKKDEAPPAGIKQKAASKK